MAWRPVEAAFTKPGQELRTRSYKKSRKEVDEYDRDFHKECRGEHLDICALLPLAYCVFR